MAQMWVVNSAEWSEYLSVASRALQKAVTSVAHLVGLKVVRTGTRMAEWTALMLAEWMAALMAAQWAGKLVAPLVLRTADHSVAMWVARLVASWELQWAA